MKYLLEVALKCNDARCCDNHNAQLVNSLKLVNSTRSFLNMMNPFCAIGQQMFIAMMPASMLSAFGASAILQKASDLFIIGGFSS